MKKKFNDNRLRNIAYIVTIMFSIGILFPFFYTICSSLKDDKSITDFPKRIIPFNAKSISVVLDYSKIGIEDSKSILDKLLKDSTLALYSVPYEIDNENIFEVKVYGVKDGKTIFYSRVHTGRSKIMISNGIYAGASLNKEVLLYGDRYKRSSEEIGYKFDINGIDENYKINMLVKDPLSDKVKNILTTKYITDGENQGNIISTNNLLLLENYKYYFLLPTYIYKNNSIIKNFSFFAFLGNTTIIVIWAMLTQVVIGSATAFGLSRLIKKKLANKIMIFYLITIMIPSVAIMIPQLMMFKSLGWYNNYKALLIPNLVPYAYFIILFKGFFDRLPNSLFDAARIDGASEWFTYTKICMPLSKPIIALIALNAFIGNWNDFFWAWLVTEKQSLWTLNVALYNLSSVPGVKQNFIMGLSVVTILPVLILSFIFSDQIKESIASSGIKG